MVVVALPKETTLFVSELISMAAAPRITALKYSKQNVVSKAKGVDSVVGHMHSTHIIYKFKVKLILRTFLIWEPLEVRNNCTY